MRILNPAGYRKLLIMILVICLTTILLAVKLVSAENYVSLLQIVVPSFFASSVLSKVAGPKGSKETSE